MRSIAGIDQILDEIKAEIQSLRVTTESTQAKVADLVQWQPLIIGGAVTLGFLMGLAIAVVKWL